MAMVIQGQLTQIHTSSVLTAMDDVLEKPSFDVSARKIDANDDGSYSDDDEDDGGPDWTRFSTMSTSKPYIPKRGDKEHEPLGGAKASAAPSGSALQQHKLEVVRAAMFGAIDVSRVASRCVRAVTFSFASSNTRRQQGNKPCDLGSRQVSRSFAQGAGKLHEHHGPYGIH